ncbi:sialate O-acetylesterase [Hymenobacter crusticola]|uniref:Sialate O-acetylesterase n=1 Tax=Hymenobacter crusticola TaxID=1770526 RepID=A0A243WK11_9BACT|nr:sialate O-acetylesterase [Hymenobacter crusticola]OUJ75444.1 sialate O-acetylesterase [Hymenobacter crusticola]
MRKNVLLWALLCVLAWPAQARIVLPRVLGHNMVLQRNKPLTIWGKAAPGEAVSVEFGKQKPSTTADADGNWQVTLQPLTASATPADLVISGSNTIRLHDILVGEVWLCSGQSNMEYTMRKNSKVTRPQVKGPNPVDELNYAHNPAIRIFLVNRKELAKPDSLHRGWSIAQDSALRSFSAAGYFFAKELYSKLHVPIGIISSAVPGSRIEPWVSEAAFQADPSFAGQKVDGEPGKFYEPMIRPLVPLTLRGFLWYQGESNCFLAETASYAQKMKTLIQSWRAAWHDSELPFYYVQLAPFQYSESKDTKVPLTKETLPKFREAQELALQIPRTGMIVTTDLANTEGGIHPGFKWEIGRRLALLALTNTYGYKTLAASGPVYQQMAVKGNAVTLTFSENGGRLVSKDGKPLSGFMLAGADGVFVPAEARIKGQQVVVTAAGVAQPTAVRFGWDESAQPNLFSKSGLPARPFRTDKPEVELKASK